MGYQERDAHIIDYGIYELTGVQPYPGGGRFRGPPLRTDRYVACVGAAQTFGPFAERPFPRLLSDLIGCETLNLGSGGAAPTFHASNAAIMSYVNSARCAVVQVLSGRSASNRLFRITEHGMHGFSMLHGAEASALEFWEHVVTSHPTAVDELIVETRANYMRDMRMLLRAIRVPKVLLWFSTRTTEYVERRELPLIRLWGAFPQFVNRAMVDELAAECDAYVECVTARGLPQRLVARDGTPASVTHSYARLTDQTIVETHNTYYPSPEMHEAAALALKPAVESVLCGQRAQAKSAVSSREIAVRRFVICALARTGSTTLMRALNRHPSIDCLNEPFNENNFGGAIRARVHDEATLSAELTALWRAYNGIKHVWHPSGWPFDGTPKLNEQVVTSGDAVVMLERQNVLRRVVSSQMSQQSLLWDARTQAERRLHTTHPFVSLDRAWIRTHIEHERAAVLAMRRTTAAAGIETIRVVYEELYESGPAGVASEIWRLLAFLLGRTPMVGDQLDAMVTMFTDRAERLNSPATYALVPGIEQIEAEFGSDETGWLFR